MKKIVPILLAVALALALCLVGFADAERYDDDPWKKRQFPRLKRSWRRQSRSLPGAASVQSAAKCEFTSRK